MAKATIQSRSGAVITVEGTEKEVSKIIALYDSSAGEAKRNSADRASTAAPGAESKRESASGLILELKRDGFFDKPKSLGDISAALEERGFLYPVTTLSGVVLRLLKDSQLRRKKIEKRWMYGK
ncbi:MAG: hypothetical protein DMG31_13670 [Acidobacteria bacterium]|nr:MAG: hypothetical protein DMG31_13670 [Acidobacteriota bacterium]